MAIAWGLTPRVFIQGSFSDTPQSGVTRTVMATGPAKVRKRFTAISNYWSGTMIMTKTELDAFITYFETTLGFGSLSMDFPDQYAAGVTTVEARFQDEGTPYSILPDGGTLDWKVSFTVEVLP